MRNLPDMTVQEHHELSIGLLACCYRQVSPELQQAIFEGLLAAQRMGMDIQPENVLNDEPIAIHFRLPPPARPTRSLSRSEAAPGVSTRAPSGLSARLLDGD